MAKKKQNNRTNNNLQKTTRKTKYRIDEPYRKPKVNSDGRKDRQFLLY
jgi:hypothetical protein